MNAEQPIQQDELNRAIWATCDIFRSSVDSNSYKDFVLTMLFLKYISDVWHDAHAPHNFDKRKPIFALPPEADFVHLYERRMEADNAGRIEAAFAALEQANLDKLADVFENLKFDCSKLGDLAQREETLQKLLTHFGRPELNLSPSRVCDLDIIGNVYEFLLKNFASTSGKKAGEFYTPSEVSQLIALLVDPQPGDLICDPTCGSGSLLMKCGKLIRERHASDDYHLYGQEAVGSTWSMAKMNMILHGEGGQRLERGDTLRAPRLLDEAGRLMQFDVVVANPPFSQKNWGAESAQKDPHHRFARGLPPDNRGDYAFILHMVESMHPQRGRAAVVVPNGVLFRGGLEGVIRKALLQENLIDTLICLPSHLFFGTNLSPVIILFRRNKQERDILFVNASEQYETDKSLQRLRPQDIERILQACKTRRDEDGFACLVSLEQVFDNEYDLSFARYIPEQSNFPRYDLQELAYTRDSLKQEMERCDHELDQALRRVGIDIDGRRKT